MKLELITFAFICVIHIGCGKPKESNIVSFNLEGILVINEFGKYQNANGYVTINNNLDSTIYVATDSLNKYLPPCFYNYISLDGKDISPIHPVILIENYYAIPSHTSKRFITNINRLPDKENPSRKMSFTYAYTTKNEGANSQWVLIKQNFIRNERYVFKPDQE